MLVQGTGDGAIYRSLQLVAGRTAQEFNKRKNRQSAFWHDRYHATAVETGQHLRQCIVYIDMNMVRAGVVDHPSEWETSGYNEILKPKKRYRIIDHKRLCRLVGSDSDEHFRAAHKAWLAEALRSQQKQRERIWTESIAVGSRSYVENVKKELGFRVRTRKVENSGSGWVLREDTNPYGPVFQGQNETLSIKTS